MREFLDRHVGKLVPNEVLFKGEKEEVGTPTLACTACAANTMDILFR
jgi:hypothetical protein